MTLKTVGNTTLQKRFKDPIEAIVTTEAERFNKQGMVGIKAYTATDFVKKFLK